MHISINVRHCDRIESFLTNLKSPSGQAPMGYTFEKGKIVKDGYGWGRRDCVWVEVTFSEDSLDTARAWIEPTGMISVDWSTWNNRALDEMEKVLIRAAAEIAKKKEIEFLDRQSRFYTKILPEIEGLTPKQAITLIEKELAG